MSGQNTMTISDAEHRQQFLDRMRSVPGAVAIVASANGAERSGMAVTAWNSVCADPPMLLACINRNASVHRLIEAGGRFSLNLLPASEGETVAIFSAQRGLDGVDRFIAGQWQDGALGQPLFMRSVAAFECEVVQSTPSGTHDIVVGRVVSMPAPTDEPAMAYCHGTICTAKPLA